MTQLFSIHRTTKQRDESLPVHSHDEGQLTFAAAGMVQVQTDDGVWLVPPQLAVWVPAGIRHRVDVLTDAELWMVHWQAEAMRTWGATASLDRAFALRITPLLRSLLNEAVSIDPASEKTQLVVRLMLHELTAMPDAPTCRCPRALQDGVWPTSSSPTTATKWASANSPRARRPPSARPAGYSRRRPD